MLYLSAMGTEKLRINTFGCGNEQLKDCDAVDGIVSQGLGVDSLTVQIVAKRFNRILLWVRVHH